MEHEADLDFETDHLNSSFTPNSWNLNAEKKNV